MLLGQLLSVFSVVHARVSLMDVFRIEALDKMHVLRFIQVTSCLDINVILTILTRIYISILK